MDKAHTETVTGRTALYPGCSLEGTASAYAVSFRSVLAAIGIECPELREWCCCGATSAHALDHHLTLSLSLRNLWLAQEQGVDEVIAPCAACYHRLVSASVELSEDEDLRRRICADTGLEYRGEVKVRNALSFFFETVGPGVVSEAVVAPLSDLRVASYYGCLNTRVPGLDGRDDMECPMFMDRLVEATGAEPVGWSGKTSCCGGSLFATKEPVSAELVAPMLQEAVARKVDCIVVACPMCHNNLDTKQADIRRHYGIQDSVPVLFITQLIGMALGLKEAQLWMEQAFVPFRRVV